MTRRRNAESTSNSAIAPIRTHQQIADILGIGRARVFFLEQQAMQKLKSLFGDCGIANVDALLSTPLTETIEPTIASHDKSVPLLSPQHGWLRVDRVISLNNGTEDIDDVVLAYRYLKSSHQNLLRPPVIVQGCKSDAQYIVQAVSMLDSALFVRCWPTTRKTPRTVASVAMRHVTVITESIFDTDEQGEFDIPLIACCLVSYADKQPQQAGR